MKSWVEKKMLQHILNENMLLFKDLLELKNEIYKHMTSLSKNEYINKLDNMVNQYTTIHIIAQPK